MPPKQLASSKKKGHDRGDTHFSWELIGSALAVVIATAAAAVFYLRPDLLPLRLRQYASPDLRPLRAPRLTDLPQFTTQYKDEMLWGSYRSGLYFGMRTRSPKSLLTGLMWFDPDDPQTMIQQRVRHLASQDDGLQQYGWVRHDGRTWGRQVLVDGTYNISLTMVKHTADAGSGPGGDWSVRINVTRSNTAAAAGGKAPRRISLVMYISDEDQPQQPWSVLPLGEPEDMREGVRLATGANKVVGPWSLHLLDVGPPRKRGGPRLHYLGLPAMEGQHDLRLAVKDLLLSIIYEQLERNPAEDRFHMQLPNAAVTDSDLALFQVTLPVGGCVDWVFTSHAPHPAAPDLDTRLAQLSGAALTSVIEQREAAFEQRFKQVLGSGDADVSVAATPTSPGFSGEEVQEVAKAALSNLLGSMGYFYGSSKVHLAGSDEPGRYWAAPLFTAVPSRSFFPRGFLWDEGFHQLLVARWDSELSRDVIAHWLDLMNSKGWIPREQILGAEAEARVPPEFVVQSPDHANPPSLFLPISDMAHQLRDGVGGPQQTQLLREFLGRAWPRLSAWYSWFNTTQAGPVPTSYRWRGRNSSIETELNPKTLTSGLDDYPRASHPTPEERHLDLRCWMALASEAMAVIGTSLGLPDREIKPYKDTWAALSDVGLLDQLHWDSTRQQYLDWGLHTQDVKLRKMSPQGPLVRVVGTPPTPQWVPHFGYVSLFPLLMRLLPPDSPSLGAVLDSLADKQLLWSPYGLRSLAASSSIYRQYNTEHDKPYWRGQVWVNINYLALSALRHYAQTPGPYQQAAADLQEQLQRALTQALVSQYYGRGYLYEQYDDRDGSGTSSHPFTGWTALITFIATGTY